MSIGDRSSHAHVVAPVAALALSLGLAPAPAAAGAWTPAAGHGEVIVTTVFDQANTGFDQAGHFTPTPKYRSWQASIYLDYGLTDWLAATVKPSVQSSTLGAPENQKFTGLGDSEIGVRGRVWRSDVSVISLQALARVPGAGGAANASLSGSKNPDFDIRLLGGKNFTIGALPAFVDVSLGFRARGGPAPNEGRGDLSLGVYLRANLMLLAQSFNVVSASSNSPSWPRWAQSKAQLSLVYAVNDRWRAQIGGFATLAGVNAYREYGALVALWRQILTDARVNDFLADLFEQAKQARGRAYTPYSRFPVGAALRAASGAIYAGANVENAAYPLGVCAETSAISAMVAGGDREILEILVLGPKRIAKRIAPCGACRQRISEFAKGSVVVYLADDSGDCSRHTLSELLPHAFGPEALNGTIDVGKR